MGPEVTISCVSNVFVKQMQFVKAGDKEQGHSHCFDHLTLLASGKIKLTALGKSDEFTAPSHIFIKAGVEHELEALEDNTTVHCIHAIRDGERVEDIIDPASVPASAVFPPMTAYPMTTDELK
jgi:quercetin dioxygenase-like cupin family protein